MESRMTVVAVSAAGLCLAGAVWAEETAACSASLYAQDGLILHYDGIENAGAGVHSDAPTKWANLAGAADGAYDVALPSWVTPGVNSMYSGVVGGLPASAISNSKVSAPTLASVEGVSAETPVTTVEVVMARDKTWTYVDNYYNTQNVFSYPHGNICFRSNGAPATNDYCVVYPISATQTDMVYWRPQADATKPHTLTATLGLGANTRWIDGVKSGTDWQGNYKSDMTTNFRFFTNLRVGIRVYAIRLYNRALTADEIAQHSKLDAVRFFGATPDDSLRMIVKNVPVQHLDGAEDAAPDPEVWDASKNRRLERGVDYRVAYYENDRPGKGLMIVTGLGDYASCPSVRKTYEIDYGFTATLGGAGSGGLSAVVRFPPADTARQLFAAWGETDGGAFTNDWPAANVVKVADVPAGADSVDVTLPEGATEAPALRFFIEHEATPRAYVTDGLRALYDGVYNAGSFAAPKHDAAATEWFDLSGNGNSVWLPDYVVVQENSLLSQVRTDPATGQKTTDKAGTYPSYTSMNGLSASPGELTVEAMMKRADKWTFTDNYGNLQNVISTPLGHVCYRESSTLAYGVSYVARNQSSGLDVTTVNSWWHATADVRDPHTLSGRLMVGLTNNSFLLDGVADPKATTKNLYQDWNTRPSGYKFFSNARADVTAYSLRLYVRRLSDLEVKRNAAVDKARFRGGNGLILAASAPLKGGRFEPEPGDGVVAVSFAAAPCARRLYAAWGTADCGDATNGWPNVALLATVPAGATRLEAVELPAAARKSHFGRLFLADVYDSTSYVTDGLVAHYDGIDNVLKDGVRGHDATTRVWSDLTGGGADVALPDYVSVKENALLSVNHVGQSAASVAVQGISGSSTTITLETVSKCEWTVWEDLGNLQSVCATPIGALGYRYEYDNGFFCYLPGSSNNKLYDWKPEGGVRRQDLHTLAVSITYQGNELYLDGARDEKIWYANYDAARPEKCNFFGAQRSDITVCGVRIYSRLLTKEEFAWNAAVDDVRYRGKAAPMKASEVVDFRGNGLMLILH